MSDIYLSVMVADLPDCYIKEQLTQFVLDPRTAQVWVVAVEGAINDWAAYIGWPTPEHLADPDDNRHLFYSLTTHHPESVANSGDKLPEAVARQLFPYMRQAYRE